MRKKRRFTHVRDNLRGDVRGKHFSTHVVERNVAGVAQERLSDGTGCTYTWHCHVGSVTGHCYRVQSQGTVTGYCHRVLPLDTATGYRHRALSLDTATGYRHRALSQSTRHGTLQHGTVTGHCHMPPITGYRHRGLPRISATAQHHSGI